MHDVNRMIGSELESPVNGTDETSLLYVGRWNRLISTTNWEKGRIIAQWREALVASGSSPSDYSDEVWSRHVGGVTPQHVGRLRRVFQRFGAVVEQFPGLYWSHFQAAVDWNDAEMWLEGALQNQWSVSQLRRMRAETLGAVADDAAEDASPAVELDEDFDVRQDEVAPQTGRRSGDDASVESDGASDPTEQNDAASAMAEVLAESEVDAAVDGETETVQLVRPFANLEDLPNDLAEAFDAFKLAILRHKTTGWQGVPCEVVLKSLDALKRARHRAGGRIHAVLVLIPCATVCRRNVPPFSVIDHGGYPFTGRWRTSASTAKGTGTFFGLHAFTRQKAETGRKMSQSPPACERLPWRKAVRVAIRHSHESAWPSRTHVA